LRGKDFKLHEGQNRLGSGHDGDVVILDKSVSREHAVIQKQDEGIFVIVDLNSVQGTFVNDMQIMNQQAKCAGIYDWLYGLL